MVVELDRLPTFLEWFEWWFAWLKKVAGQWYAALLRVWLRKDLGGRYGRANAFKEKACPECGSPAALRKGSRKRVVEVPRLGKTELERPYVRCRDCGRSWAPYEKETGLAPRRRYQRRGLLRPLEALCEMSYAKASRCYPESPSPMTLWRFVGAQQPPLEPARAKHGTCVMDATLVPGDGPRGQMAVGVAHMIQRGPIHYGRLTFTRQVVATTAGPEVKLRGALEGQRIDTLLHDGRIDMRYAVRRPARCRWHVPHRVTHVLREDRVLGRRTKQEAASLRKILFSMTDPKRAAQRLKKWADKRKKEMPLTWRFLTKAIPELIRPVADPDAYVVVSTSPIEREMREINRRMENGSHWTIAGAEAFLRHHQVARHEPKRYQEWLLEEPTTNGAPKQKESRA